MNRPSYGGGKRGYHKRYSGPPRLRKNERIRVREVRVIGPDGDQLGVIPTHEALKIAKSHGLDLVEVSASARPPVCRILDFGKFKYEESKKSKSQKSTATKLKEVKFRINIDEHDYITKVRRAETFLGKGYKLKVTLMFRGREMGHKELGFKIVLRAIEDLKTMATPDAEPRLVGRNITLTLSPLPENKRKPKYLLNDEEEPEPEEEESQE